VKEALEVHRRSENPLSCRWVVQLRAGCGVEPTGTDATTRNRRVTVAAPDIWTAQGAILSSGGPNLIRCISCQVFAFFGNQFLCLNVFLYRCPLLPPGFLAMGEGFGRWVTTLPKS